MGDDKTPRADQARTVGAACAIGTYQPPAIAWEEELDGKATVALACDFGEDPQCIAGTAIS